MQMPEGSGYESGSGPVGFDSPWQRMPQGRGLDSGWGQRGCTDVFSGIERIMMKMPASPEGPRYWRAETGREAVVRAWLR